MTHTHSANLTNGNSNGHSHLHKLSVGGSMIALGIIFGDIGTSPLYVFKAIIGNSAVDKDLIYGGMSLVFWTLTLITSFKYVYLSLNADNKGEGGIFSLYALVRRYKLGWVAFPAIIGSASLLADGFITPPISISSAVEGLELIPQLKSNIHELILPIVLTILVLLFVVQQFGTVVIGKFFGPIMLVWFSMMAVLGLSEIFSHPEVIAALNPYYGINLLINHPGGFWLLGGVFLCTTGAEALYSDLGHCGKGNIRASWILVKIALIINYLGQSAWLVSHQGQTIDVSPFYGMMPAWFLPYGVVIATLATIIASQALITGSFTLANEAMKLKFWPSLKVSFPTQLKGQIYIPMMNWILMSGCIAVVLIFRESSNMEAAYGLAITINMLMTTSLLTRYLVIKRKSAWYVTLILVSFLLIEGCFFLASFVKVFHGGWFTILIASAFFCVMYVLYKARGIRERYTEFVPLDDYDEIIRDISNDTTIPKEATNLVYLCTSNDKRMIDQNVIYSITRKRPKRADVYWFLHVEISDDPFEKKYAVDTIIPGKCFFVHLTFGFKVEHRVNLMFRKVVEEMIKNNEVSAISNYPSLQKYNIPADFKFILLNSRVSVDEEVSTFNQFIIRAYRVIKNVSLSPIEDFGLDTTNVEIERVPIDFGRRRKINLERIGNAQAR